jgi:hypothetical protein
MKWARWKLPVYDVQIYSFIKNEERVISFLIILHVAIYKHKYIHKDLMDYTNLMPYRGKASMPSDKY